MYRTISTCLVVACSLLIGLTSCRHLEDELEHFETEASVTRCINVITNVNAKIVIGNQYKTGTDVLFDIEDNTIDEVKVSVNATGYQSQEAIISFEQNSAVGLVFVLVPDTIESNLLPVHVIGRAISTDSVVTVPTAEGTMTIEVIDIKEGHEEANGSMNAFAGNCDIPILQKTGYECSIVDDALVNYFLNYTFGTSVKVLSRKATYKATTSGRVDYTIIQPYSDYTFKFGSTQFTARVYQGVKIYVAGEYIDTSDYVYAGSGESSGL